MRELKYSVDMVMCIDATGSMSGLIDKVKDNALRFYEDLEQVMADKDKKIDELRVRVIAFRDYFVDGANSMEMSEFYTLPIQKDEFARFVGRLRADGGGDEPESGLEALGFAIQSPWSKSGDRRRHIVVLWTDASAHSLEKNAESKPGNYPTNAPQSFDELTNSWEGQDYISTVGKRLILYAPDAYPWTEIATHWDYVLHHTSRAGAGLTDVDYQTILDAIANSI